MTWYVVAVSLHILAACVWIGGMVFLAAVLLPALRRPDYRGVAPPLIRATAVRFRWVGWAALLTLVITGTANLGFRGYGWAEVRDGRVWQGRFGHVLAMKLVLVLMVVLISAWHDVSARRQPAGAASNGVDSRRLLRIRRRATWVGRIVLLLSVAVMVLGIVLVRGVP